MMSPTDTGERGEAGGECPGHTSYHRENCPAPNDWEVVLASERGGDGVDLDAITKALDDGELHMLYGRTTLVRRLVAEIASLRAQLQAAQQEIEQQRSYVQREYTVAAEYQRQYDLQQSDRDRLQRENEAMRDTCELVLAFHGADTEAFVARYGHGMTTRQLCDRIRAHLDEQQPKAQSASDQTRISTIDRAMLGDRD